MPVFVAQQTGTPGRPVPPLITRGHHRRDAAPAAAPPTMTAQRRPPRRRRCREGLA
ncbi:MAG TPA: hypothetical protein VHJ17_11125 [Thermomonospora sp.]|nr:hypothetical protein [Thermomonospora sp.]